MKSDDDNQIFQSTSEDFFPNSPCLQRKQSENAIGQKIKPINCSRIRNPYIQEHSKGEKKRTPTEESSGSEKRKSLPCKIIKCSKIPFPVHGHKKKTEGKMRTFIEGTEGIS